MSFQSGATALGKNTARQSLDQKDDGVVRCVFSSVEKSKAGEVSTSVGTGEKQYWYVEQGEGEGKNFSLREINDHHVPVGEEAFLSLVELLDEYLPEIEYWETKTLPAMDLLEGFLENGELDLEDGNYSSAEASFENALQLEEKNVRALFNLGLVYSETKEKGKAKNILRELLNLKSSFVGKNQHLFNRFGISLRKNGLLDEAVNYYTRALSFIANDEHLYYNLARAHYEQGDWVGCVEALEKCRKLNPDLLVAKNLIELVQEFSKDRKLCLRKGKPPVPSRIADAVSDLLRPAKIDDLPEGLSLERGHARGGRPAQTTGQKDNKYSMDF